MLQTMFLNLLIVLAVALVAVEGQCPMALLALTFMLPMPENGAAPRFFLPPGMGGDDDDDTKPIGFTADIH